VLTPCFISGAGGAATPPRPASRAEESRPAQTPVCAGSRPDFTAAENAS
jgi:hypothetical protein